MSDAPLGIRTCRDFDDCAVELALGVLPARQRAEALSHLERCTACRAHLGELAGVGDSLVEMVPAVEPPLGFERRVLRALPAVTKRRRRPGFRPPRSMPWSPPRPRRSLATGIAAAALAAAIGLGGWAIGRSGAPTESAKPSTTGYAAAPADRLVVTDLVAHGHSAGRVFVYSGHSRWMYMSVSVGGGSQRVTCQLTRAGAPAVTVGAFWLAAGSGSWGSSIPAGAGNVTQARLVSADGTIVAVAKFARG